MPQVEIELLHTPGPLGIGRFEDGRVSKDQRERPLINGELRHGQPRGLHLLDHPRDPLPLLPHDAEVGGHTRDARVPAGVDPAPRHDVCEPHLGQQSAVADLDEVVVEQPVLDGPRLHGVVAVSHGVDDRLLPGEVRVLGHLPKEEVVQLRRALNLTEQHLVRLLDDLDDVPLDLRQLLDVVPRAGQAHLPADLEHANAGVGVVDGLRRLGEEERRGLAQHERAAAAVGQAAAQQVGLVADGQQPRALSCAGDQRGVEVGQGQLEGLLGLGALGHAQLLEGVDLHLPHHHHLVVAAVGEAIARDHHRPYRSVHVEDQQLLARMLHAAARRLRRVEPALGGGQHLVDRLVVVAVASHRTVVLQSEDQQTALGVGEGGDVLDDLVADRAFVAAALARGWTLPEGLAVEELALVLLDQRGDVQFVGHDLPRGFAARGATSHLAE